MIKQIADGITSKFTGSALATAIGGRLYRDEAMQGVAFPFCVFHIIDSQNVDTFSEKGEYYRIQFNIWHKYTTTMTNAKASLDTLESNLRSLYDWATLTISGWTNTAMRFSGSRPAFSEDDDVVGVIVEYETYIFKSR
jgi:hypothetical protein